MENELKSFLDGFGGAERRGPKVADKDGVQAAPAVIGRCARVLLRLLDDCGHGADGTDGNLRGELAGEARQMHALTFRIAGTALRAAGTAGALEPYQWEELHSLLTDCDTYCRDILDGLGHGKEE